MSESAALTQIFTGILESSYLTQLTDNPQDFYHQPLALAGVDSLAMFQVLERIEEYISHEIDYDVFELSDIETFGALLSFLKKECEN